VDGRAGRHRAPAGAWLARRAATAPGAIGSWAARLDGARRAPPPPGGHVDQEGVLRSGQDRLAYADALRDWARKGTASRHVLRPDEGVARSHPRPLATSQAAAHFELANHLWRAGRRDLAVEHFNACHRLQPENWTYKRQAWSLVGNERAGGTTGVGCRGPSMRRRTRGRSRRTSPPTWRCWARPSTTRRRCDPLEEPASAHRGTGDDALTAAHASARVSTPLLAVVLCLLWSSAFVFVKLGLRDAAAPAFAALRAVAAVPLLVVALLVRDAAGVAAMRDRRVHLAGLVLGAVNVAGFLGLQTAGMELAGIGFGAVLIYAQPLLVAALARFLLAERLRPRQVVGLLTGWLGVGLVVLGEASAPAGGTPVGRAALLFHGAAVSFGVGTHRRQGGLGRLTARAAAACAPAGVLLRIAPAGGARVGR
jgi:uncharacterized membrane protein